MGVRVPDGARCDIIVGGSLLNVFARGVAGVERCEGLGEGV